MLPSIRRLPVLEDFSDLLDNDSNGSFRRLQAVATLCEIAEISRATLSQPLCRRGDHQALCKQFAKPDVPSMFVPALDPALLNIVGGTRSLRNLPIESDIKTFVRNVYDVSGPVAILLESALSGEEISRRSIVELCSASLKLNAHCVAQFNKLRREQFVANTELRKIEPIKNAVKDFSGPHDGKHLFGTSFTSSLSEQAQQAQTLSSVISAANTLKRAVAPPRSAA